MKIVSETFSVDVSDPEFLRIDRSAVIEMPWGKSPEATSVWIERKNLEWVRAALRQCIRVYGTPAQRTTAGLDSLRVDESGPEPAPFINIFNKRPLGTRHEGAQLVTLSKPVAEKLLADLEHL